MPTVSRLKLDHPALGAQGGADLHASIEAIYAKLGNAVSDRFFQIANLANSAAVDCDHNFDVDFSSLRYDVYSWDQSNDNLTLLTSDTTPTRAQIGVVAKSGDERMQLTVTNNSGSERDLVVVLFNDPIEVLNGDLKDVDTSGILDGQVLVYKASQKKFIPKVDQYLSNSSASTSANDLTSFQNVEAGAQLNAISSSGNWVTRRVEGTFTARSKVTLEVSQDGTVWLDAQSVFPGVLALQSGKKYGLTYQPVDSTHINILIGGDGANYSDAWSSYATWKYRAHVETF